MVVPLDLSDLNSLNDKIAGILKIFGHIDILVNNGGVSVRADAASTSIDVDIKVMAVNYFGSVAMTKCRFFQPHFAAARQAIASFIWRLVLSITLI